MGEMCLNLAVSLPESVVQQPRSIVSANGQLNPSITALMHARSLVQVRFLTKSGDVSLGYSLDIVVIPFECKHGAKKRRVEVRCGVRRSEKHIIGQSYHLIDRGRRIVYLCLQR